MSRTIPARTAVRLGMLEGDLQLPSQFYKLVGKGYEKEMESMFNSLWFNYMKNKGSISLPHWSDRFNNFKVFNKFLLHLSKSGWITTEVIPARNWAEATMNEEKLLSFVSPEELEDIRAYKKFNQYILRKMESGSSTKTKVNGEIINSGLERKGFARAGNTEFSFDTEYMEQYKDVLALNLTKAMDKINTKLKEQGKERYIDASDYGRISVDILNYHLDNPYEVFTRGSNINDSRGRAISEALSKVFNPVSNKDARSLLVIPESSRERFGEANHLTAVYLFIAEILGAKSKSKFQKRSFGKTAYDKLRLHELDLVDKSDWIKSDDKLEPKTKSKNLEEELSRLENARKDVHENIWLERVYDELDAYFESKDDFYWSVPIEVDATASMIQYTGALLGDYNYLNLTNCTGDILEDFWTVDNLTRMQLKKVGTPKGYGSSKTAKELMAKSGISYTRETIKLLERELSSGRLALMDKFQDFIITNCNPKETMTPVIMDEKFTIKCNRWKNVGDRFKDYIIYDSESGELRTITHTHTHKVPDLSQFRRYFVTLLIHNLDSQVADYVCQHVNWIIDIHDAFIISPTQAAKVRKLYAKKMDEIYERREEILRNYFRSVGILSSSAADWAKVKMYVEPIKEFKCSDMALK